MESLETVCHPHAKPIGQVLSLSRKSVLAVLLDQAVTRPDGFYTWMHTGRFCINYAEIRKICLEISPPRCPRGRAFHR